MPMRLTPEVLAAQGEVVAWLGSLDVSFTTEEERWFTVDGIESPRQIGSDGSGGNRRQNLTSSSVSAHSCDSLYRF
jgi:hypothetical protein